MSIKLYNKLTLKQNHVTPGKLHHNLSPQQLQFWCDIKKKGKQNLYVIRNSYNTHEEGILITLLYVGDVIKK